MPPRRVQWSASWIAVGEMRRTCPCQCPAACLQSGGGGGRSSACVRGSPQRGRVGDQTQARADAAAAMPPRPRAHSLGGHAHGEGVGLQHRQQPIPARSGALCRGAGLAGAASGLLARITEEGSQRRARAQGRGETAGNAAPDAVDATVWSHCACARAGMRRALFRARGRSRLHAPSVWPSRKRAGVARCGRAAGLCGPAAAKRSRQFAVLRTARCEHAAHVGRQEEGGHRRRRPCWAPRCALAPQAEAGNV